MVSDIPAGDGKAANLLSQCEVEGGKGITCFNNKSNLEGGRQINAGKFSFRHNLKKSRQMLLIHALNLTRGVGKLTMCNPVSILRALAAWLLVRPSVVSETFRTYTSFNICLCTVHCPGQQRKYVPCTGQLTQEERKKDRDRAVHYQFLAL